MGNVVTFNTDEVKSLVGFINKFLDKGKKENPPKFVIVCGGTGAGKSRIIKEKFNEGYVHIDAGLIHLEITENETKELEKYNAFFDFVGMNLVQEAIRDKRNILIEIIMNKPINDIIGKMIEKGYEPKINYINNEIVKSWENNLNRGENNISALYTQDQTLSWFVRYLGLENK